MLLRLLHMQMHLLTSASAGICICICIGILQLVCKCSLKSCLSSLLAHTTIAQSYHSPAAPPTARPADRVATPAPLQPSIIEGSPSSSGSFVPSGSVQQPLLKPVFPSAHAHYTQNSLMLITTTSPLCLRFFSAFVCPLLSTATHS